MEICIAVKQDNGIDKHYVICHDFVQGVEDFCADFGINIKDIVAVHVIDE
jgi:hypothetical protein